MKSCYIVMNDNNIRSLIFSFLRKEPKKKCRLCNLILVWDNKVNDYVDINFYPWNMYGLILCKNCYKHIKSPDINILHNPNCIIN